ncbi:carboxymethylenebutenolidase homolog [Gastrophryne carolinensis]
MANEARPCPCDLGDVFHDYGAQGQEIEIENVKAYLSQPRSPTDKAVIIAHDIYGWRLPNTRFIADLLTSHGYIAICPDLFRGQEPWDVSADYINADFTDWLKTRQPTNIDREVDVVLKYLKKELHVKRFGFIGFCWGGIATHHAMLKYPELKAGVSFYGLIKLFEDSCNLLNPTLFIFGETDPILPLEQVKLLEEKLKDKAKVAYQVKVYPKQTHGFAHRKREDISPEDKPHIEEARRDMIAWLNKYIN